MMDTAMALYVSTFCVSIYGFFLFMFWWIKVGHASPVFAYITFLYGGIGLANFVNINTRIMSLEKDFDYLFEWWWPWRSVVILVFITVIAVHMTYRLVTDGLK